MCAPLTPDTRMVSVTLKLRQYFTCQYDCSVTDVVVFVLVKDILVYFPKLVIVVYSMKHCKENSIKMLNNIFLILHSCIRNMQMQMVVEHWACQGNVTLSNCLQYAGW